MNLMIIEFTRAERIGRGCLLLARATAFNRLSSSGPARSFGTPLTRRIYPYGAPQGLNATGTAVQWQYYQSRCRPLRSIRFLGAFSRFLEELSKFPDILPQITLEILQKREGFPPPCQ